MILTANKGQSLDQQATLADSIMKFTVTTSVSNITINNAELDELRNDVQKLTRQSKNSLSLKINEKNFPRFCRSRSTLYF